MPVAVWCRAVASLARGVRPCVYGMPFVAFAVFMTLTPGSVSAQQLPDISLDQLSRMQQQFGQGQSGILGAGNIGTGNQSPVILQPAVPALGGQLPASRLEQIMSARAHVRLTQFGYDQLGRASAVRVPQTGAVQDDYVLGPSDEIAVSLRGQENNEIRTTVNRDGQVIIPRLSPVPAAGHTLGEFRSNLQAAVHRAYVATDAFVSVTRLRQISVLVSGAVNSPGQRLVTGLSSVVDALLISGGVKKTGSLRNVEVRRQGRTLHVDLYAVLTGGTSAPILHLTDGDQIVVPPLGKMVAAAGLVRRPGIFELPPGRSSLSVRDLLELTGGQEVRGGYRMSVLRVLPDGRTSLVPLTGTAGQVQDSEILFVQLAADQTVSQATLAGGTGLAGNYPVTAGTHLADMLKAPGALGASPYTPFGLIVRKNPQTLMRHLVAFTPVAVLNGREDQVLQTDDMVRVLSVREERLLSYVVRAYLTRLAADMNRIRNPLSAVQGNPDSVIDALASKNDQDAELQDLSGVPADLQRQEINSLLGTRAPDSPTEQQFMEVNQRLARTAQQRRLMAGASEPVNGGAPADGAALAVPPSGQAYGQAATPVYGADGAPVAGIRMVGSEVANPNDESVDTETRSENTQASPDVTQNFMEQDVSAGGYASNREVQTFGQLARQLNVDPLVLVNFLIDHRARLDGAVRGPGSYFVGPNATLNDLVEAAGGTVNWADESGVELISTIADRANGQSATERRVLPLRKGMLAKYIVQPRDQFRFSQIHTDVDIGAVTVQGEIQHPGTFTILRGEHLSDLLKRAGGLNSTAYPAGTVFLRKSAARIEHEGYLRAADEVENQLIVAMTRVGENRLDPTAFSSMRAFVQELRSRQVLGRISITADPKMLAADPAADPLLEAGDVIYIPPRPTTVAVLGQVQQPGHFRYRKNATLEDYLAQSGGYAQTADESHTYIVLPDGEARRVTRSWLSFDVAALPPGSTIVVPRDIAPLDLRQTIIDVSQVFSQFAVSIASIAVLSTR